MSVSYSVILAGHFKKVQPKNAAIGLKGANFKIKARMENLLTKEVYFSSNVFKSPSTITMIK